MARLWFPSGLQARLGRAQLGKAKLLPWLIRAPNFMLNKVLVPPRGLRPLPLRRVASLLWGLRPRQTGLVVGRGPLVRQGGWRLLSGPT